LAPHDPTQPTERIGQVVRQFLDFHDLDPAAAASFRDRLRTRLGDLWIIGAFDALLGSGPPAADLIDQLRGAAGVALDRGAHATAQAYLDLARRMAPDNALVQHDWAMALFQTGHPADAMAAFRRALELGLADKEASLNLALAMIANGDGETARSILTELAVDADPVGNQALLNLVFLDIRSLDLKTARTRLDIVLSRDPDDTKALSVLASLDYTEQDYAGGTARMRHALTIAPDDHRLHRQLGELLAQDKQYQAAEAAFRTGFDLKGDINDIAAAHLMHRYHAGRESLWAVVEADLPRITDREAYYGLLGHRFYNAYFAMEAIHAFQLAFTENPGNKAILTAIAALMRQGGDTMAARQFLDWAMESVPHIPEVWQGLGTSLYETGEQERAVDLLREGVRRFPGEMGIQSTLLLGLHYDPRATAREIRDVAESLALQGEARYADSLPAWSAPATPVTRDGRLTVGFMSGGFRNHPVGHFSRGLIENIDRRRFRVILLDSGTERDRTTDVFLAHCDEWVDLTTLTDAVAVGRARALGMDVFIDMAGCFQGARLALPFARVAPVQMKWVGGLCGTTGVRQFDHVISDWIESPPGAEADFVEQAIYRLPNDYVTFYPASYAPPVQELPALANGHVTFGCLNNYAKVNGPLLDAWSRILSACPGARLVLLSQQYNSTILVDDLKSRFARRGIDPARVEFIGTRPHRVVLQTYGRIDIGLDPFPYGGGLTTCEALHMGVPVVTAPGETFASRHSASHLTHSGLGDLVCAGVDAYVARAVDLARDVQGLARLRADLRRRMEASPLMDHARFARDFETMLYTVTGRTARPLADAP
jgi:predicted O-linked N-acetylglucosamine transferase (SPINDLY family)